MAAVKREFGEMARLFVNHWLIEAGDKEKLQRQAEFAFKVAYEMGRRDEELYGKGGFWRRFKKLFKGEA